MYGLVIEKNHHSIAVHHPHFCLKSIPQLDFCRLFDASLSPRLLWRLQEHLITVSSSSDNSACGESMLVGPRIFVHRCKLETKLTLACPSCGRTGNEADMKWGVCVLGPQNAKEVEMGKAVADD